MNFPKNIINHYRLLIQMVKSDHAIRNLIVQGSSPILGFGDFINSEVATLGINPSNLEFVSSSGDFLENSKRRILPLTCVKQDIEIPIKNILESQINYFNQNPYNFWFKQLDYILNKSGYSYYFPFSNSCHLDLVPFATKDKWSNLSNKSQNYLFKIGRGTLNSILLESKIKVLILNGTSVVSNFKKYTNINFTIESQKKWALPRKGKDILGLSYSGKYYPNKTSKRSITVLGFNHNIQSSYGVTNNVKTEIRNWINNKIDIK